MKTSLSNTGGLKAIATGCLNPDDLVRRQVAVIVVLGNTPSAPAAKSASTTTPIVFRVVIDPVEAGQTSLNRPNGNVTGISALGAGGRKAARDTSWFSTGGQCYRSADQSNQHRFVRNPDAES